MNKVRTLFLTFFKIGAFTFGGGYAMVALLANEFIEKKHWIDRDEFFNMVAIAESTPGPMAVNSATYIGYEIAGIKGAAAATLAVCLPSFVVIYCISLFFDQFLALTWVSYAFRGIQVCVIYLILTAGLRMFKSLEKSRLNMILFVAVFCAMLFCSIAAVSFSTVFYILICGAIGVCAYGLTRLRKGGSKK